MHVLFDFGYIDTGTGSLVIQSLIGIAAGVGVFGRKAISSVTHKLSSIVRRGSSDNKK